MKKILLVILAVAIFVSCDRNTHILPDVDGTITFGDVTTRADVAFTEFGVWGTYHNAYSLNNGYKSLFNNTKVYFENGGWTYDNKAFWPLSSYVYFVAVAPYDAENPVITENVINEDGVNVVYYTVDIEAPDTADFDLLYATKFVNTTSPEFDNTKRVELLFRHFMTKVNFKIAQDFSKNTDDDFLVTKFTVSGIKKSASYLYLPYYDEDTGTASQLKEATYGNEKCVFEQTFDEPINLRTLGGNFYPIFDDGLLLIPQDVASQDIKITVDYIYKMKDSDTEEPRFIETYLPVTDLWQSGNSISYAMKVSETHNISFLAPTVEPWGAPQNGGTIIIK